MYLTNFLLDFLRNFCYTIYVERQGEIKRSKRAASRNLNLTNDIKYAIINTQSREGNPTNQKEKKIMKMTKSEAMTVAINLVDDYMNIATELTSEQKEKLMKAKEVYTTYKATLDKPRTISPETAAKREKAAEARKVATKEARAKLIAEIAPILRKYLTADVTAKELYALASTELPTDFTAAKVQNILIREMKPELVRTERKKGGDTYRLA